MSDGGRRTKTDGGRVWADGAERMLAAAARAAAHFGARLRSVEVRRSVDDAPLDTLVIELDRVRRRDPESASDLVGGASVVSPGVFEMVVRTAPVAVADSGLKGPYDLGPRSAKEIKDLMAGLAGASTRRQIEVHDNLYGRAIVAVDREGPQYLLRAVAPSGRIERSRVTAPEIKQMFALGWWR